VGEVDAVGLHERAEAEVGDRDDPELEPELGGERGAALGDELGEGAVDAPEADECEVVSFHVDSSLVESGMRSSCERAVSAAPAGSTTSMGDLHVRRAFRLDRLGTPIGDAIALAAPRPAL
jgi:hypothetical protein